VRAGVELELRTNQRLIITPQLKKSIEILQSGTLELWGIVSRELAENPVLEVDEMPLLPEPEALPLEEPPEPEWLGYFLDATDTGYTPAKVQDRDWGEGFGTGEYSLQEYVLSQVKMSTSNVSLLRAAEFLVGNLDDNGYLRITLEDAGRCCGISRASMEPALELIQSVDPPGVGARTVSECLLLQLGGTDTGNDLAVRIVKDHLHDLAAGRIRHIAQVLRKDPCEVQAAIDVIRTRDPKPGRRIARSHDTAYAVPDLVVERTYDDGIPNFMVMVNDSMLPLLRISPYYRELLRSGPSEQKVRGFVRTHIQRVVWLAKCIEQRRLTLLRIMETIAQKQQDFFLYGLGHLRPLSLRHVGDAVGRHQSTISRAVANKYVQTPFGLFPLSLFFSSGIGDGSRALSAESVKQLIREMVRAESASDPLSDQAIAGEITRRGFPISRRTVSKYRSDTDMPPSYKRRRYAGPRARSKE
jgi:RNA polymerase sigma-54 factor